MQMWNADTQNDNPYFPFLDPAVGSISFFLSLVLSELICAISFTVSSVWMDLLEKIPDPILSFLIRTRYKSDSLDKICPQTERFQTFCQAIGGVVFTTPVGEG